MRFTIIALTMGLWQTVAPCQTVAPDSSATADNGTGVIGVARVKITQDYAPLTRSERLRVYFQSAFGPMAVLRATASGAIAQAKDTPKEWHQGAEAFGERIGNSFAEHVVRKTIESGAAAALREDNRYIRSTETGVWKRSRHVLASVFTARNEAGGEHFAYSRFGGAVGSSFISRIWQPHSSNTSGDAAVTFGIMMATDLGWNALKEFSPARFRRH